VADGSGIGPPGGEYKPPRAEEPAAAPPEQEITPEELTELMRQLKITDFLLSNLSSLAQLAYAKLDRSSRDLPDARLAIDALRAVLPVLEGSVPEQVLRDFGQVVSNLQLAYVGAADEAAGEQAPASGEADAPTEPEATTQPDADS